ncbi:MAG: ABC transporter permease [Elusimicrobia bacterium]|nr:ABC transporter permease [Elusimicrobiota bacterium]
MKGNIDLRRAVVIAQKEFRHIARDILSAKIILAAPLIIVSFFAVAINFEVRDVSILVADDDRTRLSRELMDQFDRSGYFKIRHGASAQAVEKTLSADRAKAVMIIAPQFQRNALTGHSVSAQVLLDGADDLAAVIVTSYLSGLRESARRRLLGAQESMVRLRTRYIFNEELDSHWFIIPGLFATTLGLFAILLPALTVSREWESGSMELLLASPARPIEIILGKLMPYILLCTLHACAIYLVIRLGFGVPFLGSHLVFAVATGLFLIASASQGLLISNAARGQRLAYTMTTQTGHWPIQMMSGFIFPVQNMPWAAQLLAGLLPAGWYIQVLRSSFLRAGSVLDCLWALGCLAVLAGVFFGFACSKFKSDLEP